MHKILQNQNCNKLSIYALGGAMKFGYIRVSTNKQNLDVQREFLSSLKLDKIFEEKASGRNLERQELTQALSVLRKGDTFVVYDLSRLGRTVYQVIKLIDYFNAEGINFVSLKENFDTSTPFGKAMISILASFNQMQVEIQNEKIKDGLINAKNKGIKLGRKPIPEKTKRLITALSQQKYSNREIAEQLGISIRSVINYKIPKN